MLSSSFAKFDAGVVFFGLTDFPGGDGGSLSGIPLPLRVCDVGICGIPFVGDGSFCRLSVGKSKPVGGEGKACSCFLGGEGGG